MKFDRLRNPKCIPGQPPANGTDFAVAFLLEQLENESGRFVGTISQLLDDGFSKDRNFDRYSQDVFRVKGF